MTNLLPRQHVIQNTSNLQRPDTLRIGIKAGVKLSLIVAAHNNQDIVVGSDSLAIVYDVRTGKEYGPLSEPYNKIRRINSHTALLVSGQFDDVAFSQFLNTFIEHVNHERINDAETIYRMFGGWSYDKLHLNNNEGISTIIVGYSKKGPFVRWFHLSRVDGHLNRRGSSSAASECYEAAGYGYERAKSLLSFQNINDLETDDLRDIVSTVIGQCIDEFPELGGPVVTEIISKPVML